MAFLAVLIAATPVVHDPAHISSIVSPTFEYVLIKYSINSTGLLVECLPSRLFIGIMLEGYTCIFLEYTIFFVTIPMCPNIRLPFRHLWIV